MNVGALVIKLFMQICFFQTLLFQVAALVFTITRLCATKILEQRIFFELKLLKFLKSHCEEEFFFVTNYNQFPLKTAKCEREEEKNGHNRPVDQRKRYGNRKK